MISQCYNSGITKLGRVPGRVVDIEQKIPDKPDKYQISASASLICTIDFSNNNIMSKNKNFRSLFQN